MSITKIKTFWRVNIMYTKKEIKEIFKLMGLLKPKEREYFQNFSNLNKTSELDYSHDILADNKTSIFNTENKDAELEGNT